VVGFVALIRLLPLVALPAAGDFAIGSGPLGLLLVVLSLATMTFGNLLALRQQNLFRLLGFSSVAHAGYMLAGLAAGIVGLPGGGADGMSALLFYLAAYSLMTVGMFALISGAGSREIPLRTVSDLGGLGRIHPGLALAIAVCLFGFAGLPPTAGFLAKWNLFVANWSQGGRAGQFLACALALNAAVAAWYYLRLIAVMYLDSPPESRQRRLSAAPAIAGAACAIGTIVLFVIPQPVWRAATAAFLR
jgi:NADH-quinone oxidoreductase subunit N